LRRGWRGEYGMMEVIQKAEQYVQKKLGNDSTGHDWYHIDRVRKLALYISNKEQKGDSFIIELASLFHDVLDDKLVSDVEREKQELMEWFVLNRIPSSQQNKIVDIIEKIGYKGGNEAPLSSIEGQIVRDADRLDAIGAIGIARTFAYGGKIGQLIYNPSLPIRLDMTVEQYRNERTSTIHHFYEKLLLLKEKLFTDTAKTIATERHAYMEQFLQQFFREWKGEFDAEY
jgi:uncharacterized protein